MSEVIHGLFDEPQPEPTAIPLNEWGVNWILSDAPRTPSEAVDQARRIKLEQRVSDTEAGQIVAERLRQIESEAE